MDDMELIEWVRRRREEEVCFFSSAAKPERERWIAQEYLRNLSITVLKSDLLSPPQYNDVDVVFRDAQFQVKEITERNCRRSSEVKQALKRAKTARHPMELYETPVAEDIVWEDAYPLICDCALDPRYPKPSRSKLDLLEPISKLFQEHRDAGQLDEPEEV